FAHDLLPRTAFSVHGTGTESVVAHDFVVGNDELEAPGRVGGLQFCIVATAAGRMTEANAVAAIEHEQEHLLAKQTVEEWLVELERREVLVQGFGDDGTESQIELVVLVNHRALVVVFRSAELPPALAAEEVHALVFGRVDVAGPEKTDVLVV